VGKTRKRREKMMGVNMIKVHDLYVHVNSVMKHTKTFKNGDKREE
jgi:hypothetical protein